MRTAIFFAGLASAAPALADDSGKEIYDRVCAACHGTKFDKAPQLGDRKAWAPLIEEGQHVLTAHAWVGVRNMPPRGGDASLELKEFARAVAYMARAAGGNWRDPDEAMLARIREEEKKRLHGEASHK
jgi:cytochrome c5